MRCTRLPRGEALSLAVAAVTLLLGSAAAPAAASTQPSRPQGHAPLPAQVQVQAAPQPQPRPQAGQDAFTPSALDVNFPPTPVGQTSTATCASECFTVFSGCDGSGDIGIDKPLSAPFDVFNFRVTSGNGCTGTPVTLPVHLFSGEALLFDFSFSPTVAGSFTDTLGLGGLTWRLSGSTPSTTGCVADAHTLCLNNGRFKVTANWQKGNGQTGMATVVQLTPDTGYLWFFNSSNVEMVIKVLNGCGLDNHFWVFAGGLTNVMVTTHVTDTQTGAMKTYINPLGTPFQPLQDTSAFLCP
jgi:hypothetical protein